MRTEGKVWILMALFIALFGFGLYSAFRPESYPLKFVRGEVRPISKNVVIGPYPDKREWKKLKNHVGVQVLVSLMDPDSRIEGGFVEKERAMARKYGMEFKNFPMDFMHLSDDSNKEQARRLAAYILKTGKDKKFYVHCYLGRHRVKIFADAFKEMAGEGRHKKGKGPQAPPPGSR